MPINVPINVSLDGVSTPSDQLLLATEGLISSGFGVTVGIGIPAAPAYSDCPPVVCLPNAVPIDIATEGLLSTIIAIATDGFIGGCFEDIRIADPFVPPNNIGSLVGDPRREWYTREDRNDTLFGPLTYQHANAHARYLSKTNDSGLAQIVTNIGSSVRGGDPIKTPIELFVVYIYVRGKCTLGGRAAEYNSDQNLVAP